MSIKQLLKYLEAKNIAESLDDEKLQEIAEDVIRGYEIDEGSRSDWLEINQEAMKIFKNTNDANVVRDFPFEGAAKLVFPLLAPATIQLASRLISHVVRNDKVMECAVLGKDYPQIDPQSQQPIPGVYVKAEKARKVTSYANYEFLIESDSWLKDTHKLLQITSSWGMCFRYVYYDYITQKNCFDLMHPEDVVINQRVTCLEKAPRITIKHYFTKNEIMEKVRSGYFLDHDLDVINPNNNVDDDVNDPDEIQPVYTFLCQYINIDLDNDGYLEPYKVYVNKESKKVYCIIPAFEYKDLYFNPDTEQLVKIERRLDIVDYHAIDDPEGGFYSIGLNYLLLHPNKALTAIQRQLIDAGTLANAGGVSGFVTGAFKTKERSLKLRLGEFPVLECNPNVDPQKQFIQMPLREPSQVLLNLFQLLIETSKNSGFLSDILTGDVEMQNVPATTSLAMTEQATRAFKPIITKLYISLKKEFKMWFHLNAKYLKHEKYIAFQDDQFAIGAQDFDESSLDICPVADPTMSSDAFKYAQTRALLEGVQIFGAAGAVNMQDAALRYFTDLGFKQPETIVQQQQQQPDAKLVEVQMKSQVEQGKLQIQQGQLQLNARELEIRQLQFDLKQALAQIKAIESGSKSQKLKADADTDYADIALRQRELDLQERALAIEDKKAEAALIAARRPVGGNND